MVLIDSLSVFSSGLPKWTYSIALKSSLVIAVSSSAVPPSIADEVTELVVSRLSPLVIGCTASGVPEPMLHWSKDGMKLPMEGNGYSILSSG